VPITDLWFGVSPLDYGAGFSFLSYNGQLRCVCVSDAQTVPDAPKLAADVRDALLEVCGGGALAADVEVGGGREMM
jgi:hypothetical protein